MRVEPPESRTHNPDVRTYCNRVLAFVAGAALLLSLVFLLVAGKEPRSDGRRLSYWLAAPMTPRGQKAIRDIGTNGIPFLLRWLQAEPVPWRTNFAARLRSLGSYRFARRIELRRLGSDRMAGWIETSQREQRAMAAASGLATLGDKAIPAIPELTRMMNNPASYYTAVNAAVTLSRLGTNALPSFIEALEDPRHPDRRMVVCCLAELQAPPGAAAAAVPTLIRCLSVSDTNMLPLAALAARALGQLQASPDLAVPALVSCLKETNQPSLPVSAAYALGRFPARPDLAVPALADTLDNSPPNLRQAVISALAAYTTNSPDIIVPALIRCLKETNQAWLAASAAHALGTCRARPDLAVPALVAKLETTPSLRQAVIPALAAYTTNARPAVPALRAAFPDQELYIQGQIIEALMRIAPEVLTNPPFSGSR